MSVDIYEIDSMSELLNARGVVNATMAENGHGVPKVTHVVHSDNRLIGAFSVAYAPVLFFWMHTERANVLHSFRALRQAESILKDMGHPHIILPIQKESPFYPFIGRLGYGLAGKGEIFMKG